MRNLISVRGVLAVAACIMYLSIGMWAQDYEEPNSLGDVARQTRAQHASTIEDKSSKEQVTVDDMQQHKTASAAPNGFVNYNAGDYRLFVPFPFNLEGRENGGAVLHGSKVGINNAEVLAGTPLAIPANLSDQDLSDTARQLAQAYSPSASCSAIKLGSHTAFRCGLSKAFLLDREVTGSIEFVVATNSLIPVMCVSADDMHKCVTSSALGQTCGNIHHTRDEVKKAKAAKLARMHDQLASAHVCDQIIYPSIQLNKDQLEEAQLKEDIVAHPATTLVGKASQIEDPEAEIPEPENASAESDPYIPTVAEVARQTRRASHGQAEAMLDAEGKDAAPAGFQTFVLRYCRNPQQCSDASVVIPEKSEVVSRTNGQHIFKAALDGEPVMLYAGPADVNAPYRSLTDADYTRMRDLANSNGWSREKPDSISLQDLTVGGNDALMTRFRFQRDQKHWWIGERVLLGNQGSQFLLGCAAPEEHFSDAEALCTTLVKSLRLE
jgi:hypothetical protein